jgi:hypothetical protein
MFAITTWAILNEFVRVTTHGGHARAMERTGGVGLDVTQRCTPWSAPHKNYQLTIFRQSIAKFLIAASFVTSVTCS